MSEKMLIVFPFHLVRKDSRVVIYGAGDVGQAFYWELVKSKYAQIAGWIDRAWEKEKELEYPKTTLQSLADIDYEYIVIAVNSPEVGKQITESLVAFGIPKHKIIYDNTSVLYYEPVNYKLMYENREKKQNTLAKAGRNENSQRKLRMGFLAAGNIANTIAETVLQKCSSLELYAVASRDSKKAEQFKEKWGFQKSYASYEALAKDSDVDIIYISTPVAFHYEHTMMCLSAGKHVICEKPFAVNYAQAKDMIDEAKKRNLFLSDGLWVSYLPLLQDIKQVLQENTIGRISTVIADQFYYSLQNPRLTEYHLCGGFLLEAGFYLINYAKLFLGNAIKNVHAVSKIDENGIDVQDSIVLEYSDAMACLSCGMTATSGRAGYAFGEKGYMQIADANEYKELKVYNNSGELLRNIRRDLGYEYELLACEEAIRSGRIETAERTHQNILEDMQLIDAIRACIGLKYEADK